MDDDDALRIIDAEAFDPDGHTYTSPHMAGRRTGARDQLRRFRAAGLLAAPALTTLDFDALGAACHAFVDAHRDPIADATILGSLAQRVAALAAPVAPRPAEEGYFSDLTARLVAADAGWCLTYGDERANPDYIRWLARHIDAFEDHASPAAPADDEAAALREKSVGQLADRIAMEAFAAWHQIPNRDAYVDSFMRTAARNAAFAALREGQQK